MPHSLFSRFDGPLPRPLRRAAEAGGAAAWARTAALLRARGLETEGLQLRITLAGLRLHGRNTARLGLLSRRHGACRQRAHTWRDAAPAA